LQSIPPEFCGNLPHLTLLDLRDNKIEVIPDEIAMLQSLLRLDLSNNSINSLPSGLSSLANLVSLQLEGNPIRSIRRDIIQCGTSRILKTLRERDGKSNKIQTSATIEEKVFPDRFQMQKNHAMSMMGKALLEIPDFVFSEAVAAGVHSVDLSKNKLAALPEGLLKVTHLISELNVSSNLLRSIRPDIAQFERINYINLACNMLEDLPVELGGLVSLRELNINCNK
jgi:Leucine-rich repeat (LRR) protein